MEKNISSITVVLSEVKVSEWKLIYLYENPNTESLQLYMLVIYSVLK